MPNFCHPVSEMTLGLPGQATQTGYHRDQVTQWVLELCTGSGPSTYFPIGLAGLLFLLLTLSGENTSSVFTYTSVILTEDRRNQSKVRRDRNEGEAGDRKDKCVPKDQQFFLEFITLFVWLLNRTIKKNYKVT